MRKAAFISLLVVFSLVLIPQALSAQDLMIDYRYNVSRPDSNNYLTFRSAIRYISVNKDSCDAVSGASTQHSTLLFAPLQTDIMGRATISGGFRGLLLFPVANDATRVEDNLNVYKDGTSIVMEYVHRGVAYRIQTDQHGNIGFPRGDYKMRTIGSIKGAGPQVLSSDFSADGTSKSVDWRKVWDPRTPSGNIVVEGEDPKTGPIQNDYGDMMAMFNWDGTLAVTFENSILTISGTLRPMKR